MSAKVGMTPVSGGQAAGTGEAVPAPKADHTSDRREETR
jgi:hypothetical protein